MKNSPKLLIALSSLFLFSCKPANQTSALAVTIAPAPAQALPAPLDSCKGGSSTGGDLAAPSFAFTTFRFQWGGANELKIAYIQIDFKSGLLSGGKYQCIIAGDELEAVLYPKSDGISGGDATTYKSSCGIRCGALNVVSTVSAAYFSGTAKIVGTEVDGDGNASPVVTEADVAVQYTKP
jgi:hypothetical protein